MRTHLNQKLFNRVRVKDLKVGDTPVHHNTIQTIETIEGQPVKEFGKNYPRTLYFFNNGEWTSHGNHETLIYKKLRVVED